MNLIKKALLFPFLIIDTIQKFDFSVPFTMNKTCYRKIFSKHLNAIIAVAESARSQGKHAGEGGVAPPSGRKWFPTSAP